MKLSDMTFHRQFSMSTYKDQRLMLGKMTFSKDFITAPQGRTDLYPVLEKADEATEQIANGRYVTNGRISRMFCQFFPYATYELTVNRQSGSVGFSFHIASAKASVALDNDGIVLVCGEQTERAPMPEDLDGTVTFIVSCRPGAFDIYFNKNGAIFHHHTFEVAAFERSHDYKEFSLGYAALTVDGASTVHEVLAYIDNGVSLADLRSIRYENGEVMVEDGKVYLTASIRMHAKMFQGVFSWIPGTAELHLVGVIFYDAGDGLWCGDVAASILYHRENKRWMLWVCSFNHDHILAHAEFEGDPRFGVNVIDITLAKRHEGEYDYEAWATRVSDEDPDFFYNEQTGKWHMAICRMDRTPGRRNQYRYAFFESDRPFDGYTFVGMGIDGAETGGSFVRVDGEQYFICGNENVNDYRIYSKDGMKNAKFDFPDGGFRGWGTLLPIKCGSRTRYFWITFDRHNGSPTYNWSYGNVHGFEGVIE